jgi:hypothetical protein
MFTSTASSSEMDFDSFKRAKLENEMKQEGFDAQIERDVRMWQATFSNSDNNVLERRRNDVLSRIFLILKFGKLLYRSNTSDNSSWNYWKDAQLPIATALSHGSRILIQLPRAQSTSNNKLGSFKSLFQLKSTSEEEEGEYDHSFWTWLITGTISGNLSHYVSTASSGDAALEEQKIIFKRLAATHSIKYAKTVSSTDPSTTTTITLSDGTKKQKYIYEVKEKIGLNARNTKVFAVKEHVLHHHRHWGMNIACGGSGNMNEQTRVESNGEHGHVYLYYMAPSLHRHGGIMIGIEGSEYGKQDQSGTSHTLQASSPEVGVTGGMKWSRLKQLGIASIPDKYDSMFVDLADGWKFLLNKQFNQDIIRETSN